MRFFRKLFYELVKKFEYGEFAFGAGKIGEGRVFDEASWVMDIQSGKKLNEMKKKF